MSENAGQRTYPQGVSSWIDTEQPDPEAAAEFYGGLLGWEFENAMPPGAPAVYLIALLDGEQVGAIGTGGPHVPRWNTYFAVDDADALAQRVLQAGGGILEHAQDIGRDGAAGRLVVCADPQGAELRLWQARARLGSQVVNLPGAWNFSDLRTRGDEIADAKRFYTALFGWEYVDMGSGLESMIAVPGYGDHLAATVDPDIRERQKGAPERFADVIGAVHPVAGHEQPHWHVKVSVASRADAIAATERLGGTVLSTDDTTWADLVTIRDPQGAVLTLSEFHHPRD